MMGAEDSPRVRETAVEYILMVADELSQREDAIGSRASDGPTSDEIRSLLPVFGKIEDWENGRSELSLSDLWNSIQQIAAVSDKWIDPEVDPLGLQPREFLENVIGRLGEILNRNLPERADEFKQWSNLRVIAHCANRTVKRQELNPHLAKRIWRRLFSK